MSLSFPPRPLRCLGALCGYKLLAAKFAKNSQSSPRPVLPMLPFPLTLLSVSNSNHLRAFLAPCELDVRRKSFRSLWRTPARQARLAFLPEALAMTGAPDSATSMRRYREALANETRHHLAPYPPGIVQAFPNDANCHAAFRTARALSVPESRRPSAVKSCARGDRRRTALQLRFLLESASQSHCHTAF